MSLQSTADAVLQLMLQCLPSRDILVFARCSQQTMRLADSPIVWKHAIVRLDVACDAAFPFVASPLLRHAPFAVRLLYSRKYSSVTDAVLQSLLQLSASVTIRELDVTAIPLDTHAQAMRLLQNSSMRRLRVLLLGLLYMSDWSDGVLKAICSLPELETLRLQNRQGDDRRWKHLPSAPSLTSLHCLDALVDPSSCLPCVARCERLRHFSIVVPAFYHDHSFRDFFASPAIQRLVMLKIDGMYARKLPAALEGDVDPAEYGPAFAGMRCLTSLHLTRVVDSVALFPALALAPALTDLQISFASVDASFTAPSLKALLTAAPLLTVTLTGRATVCNALFDTLRLLLESEPNRLLLRDNGLA